jgi:hypothetical protein
MPPVVLNDFPVRFDGEMPPFTPEGCLPPGDFLPSRLDFEMRFVDAGDHTRRASIYLGWNAHRHDLAHAGIPESARQLLNGSYTTSRNSPGDIDIAVEVPVADSGLLRTLGPDHSVVSLLLGPPMKKQYDCDAYPIYSLPQSDPLYTSVTVRAIEYWTKWFGRTRSGASKGRVWATTGG